MWPRLPPVCALLLLTIPAAAADWASFHNDALGTGFVADSSYPVYQDVWWSNKTLANQQIYASPVIKDQVLVTADRGGVVRGLDAESGHQLWTFTMPASVEGTPAIAGERVYVVDVAGNLKALNLRDGRVEATATTPVGATYGAVREHQGKLFIGNNAGQMKAYYATTLTLLWTFDLTGVYTTYAVPAGSGAGATPVCSGLVSAQPIYGAPAVYGDRVIFGSFNHWIFAVDEQGLGNGRTTLHWMYYTGDIVASSPSIRVIDSNNYRVLVGSYDGKLYNFNGALESTGGNCDTTGGDRLWSTPLAAPLWKFTVPLGVERKFESSPAVSGNRIYFGANNGHTYAVNADDGTQVWESTKTGTDLASVTSSPAVANGIVVVGSKDKNVYWLDTADGSIKKTFAGQGAFGTSPAIDGDRAYIASTDGTVYMFGPKVPARPDLAIQSIVATATQVKVVVQNIGDKEAGASKVRLFVDGTLLADVSVPAIAATSNRTVFYNGSIAAGVHQFQAVADFGAPDAVKESNESNNALSVPQTIGTPPPPPPPPGGSSSSPSSAAKGKIPAWNMAVPIALIGVALLLRRRIR